MDAEALRQRHPPPSRPTPDGQTTTEKSPHPGGEIKHGTWKQALRMFLFAVYFNGSCLAFVPSP